MKIVTRTILISLILGMMACQPTESADEGYVITGDLTGFPDSTMIYLRNLSTDVTFDSSMILGGKFDMKGFLEDTPERIWIHASVDKKFAYANLLIGNEKVHLSGDLEDFPWHVTIEGSTTQEGSNALRKLTAKNEKKRDSLVQEFFALSSDDQSGDPGVNIWKIIGELDSETEELKIDFVKAHTDTYEGMITLGYLRDELPKDTLEAIFESFDPNIKESKFGRVIEVYLGKQIAEVGDTYYDFTAYNQKEKEVKFSEVKGKYTLLEFTSAYCGPCIEAADELRELHQAHSDSLHIVSFSGDPQKKTWLKSLVRDSVNWTSLWDGKGKYSETAIQYDVSGFPTFYVIDDKGKIVDKWIGYGKGLLTKKLEGVVL